MNYETVMRTEKFFKALATALLMPVAILAGVSVGMIIALLLGVLIYGALIFYGVRGGARWLARRAGAFLFPKSFGKAARTGEVSEGKNGNIRPEPPTAAGGLPGDSIASCEEQYWKARLAREEEAERLRKLREGAIGDWLQ